MIERNLFFTVGTVAAGALGMLWPFFNLIGFRCQKPFMHTGVQMKCVSKPTDARRTSKGKVISLLDCKNLNRIFNELEKHSLE